MGWDYVYERRPPTDLVFIPQVIYEYAGPIEWYWQGKLNNSEKYLSQYQLVHHKSHMDWTGRNPDLRGNSLATNRLSILMSLMTAFRWSYIVDNCILSTVPGQTAWKEMCGSEYL
jgi:hypothetical protein